jgi:GNAT superfamily N-acetyltransferase
MGIRPLDTGRRRDVRAFIRFPLDLHRDSPRWAPPLAASVRLSMDRQRHPFYRHSDAAFFLAEDGGAPLGRLAVLENRRYNAHTGRRTAFFCWFDAVNDQAVADGLFAAAMEWAAGRGLTSVIGPKGFLRSDAPGILVEGFEHRPALGMPYNPAYYPGMVEAAGFTKEVDFLSGYLDRSSSLPERFRAVADRVARRRGYRIRTFRSRRELRAWVPRIQRINNEAFTDVWGYYPVDDAEAALIARQFAAIADPSLIKLLMKGDEVIGFCFVFPDVSDALKASDGRLWPFGWLRILRQRRNPRRLSANGVALLPEYQGLGGSAVLYAEMARTMLATDADHCDVAQALETNVRSLGDLNGLGVRWYKRHRVYRREIPA